MLISILSIAFVVAFVYATFVEDFKRQLFKLIFKKLNYTESFLDYKPFSCANCMSFWISFSYLLIYSEYNIYIYKSIIL